ncbi:g10307 [Coccomyxa viridis]|uniref:G10307 protein n=1 Tax=Coccomyxa viridis TaxID=1274662 RepID=A0ABP1G5D8_9CHLO
MRHKRRGRSLNNTGDRERDLSTIDLVNSILDENPVDLSRLRKVCAVKGLVNNQLRARVWPVLLGVEGVSVSQDEYMQWAHEKHADSSVVDCDVQRSLWSYTQGWTDEERDAERARLRNILNAAVSSYSGDVHYYQGLHSVASVLLFVVKEHTALAMLQRLVVCHLRDCTRPNLDAVLELLSLLLPVLRVVDPQLHAHIEAADMQAHFALSWYITWFAYNLDQLQDAARLYDLFLASHPIMPIYAAAAILTASRERILECEADYAEMHHLLTNLPPLGAMSPDELVRRAAAISQQCPPKHLLRKHRSRLVQATAAASYKKDGIWHVPDRPSPRKGIIGEQALSDIAGYMRGQRMRKKPVALVSMASAATVLVAALGVYLVNVHPHMASWN